MSVSVVGPLNTGRRKAQFVRLLSHNLQCILAPLSQLLNPVSRSLAFCLPLCLRLGLYRLLSTKPPRTVDVIAALRKHFHTCALRSEFISSCTKFSHSLADVCHVSVERELCVCVCVCERRYSNVSQHWLGLVLSALTTPFMSLPSRAYTA